MLYSAPDHTQRENFHQGRDDLAYRYLGAHHVLHNGEKHWHFAVWAPNARAVYLTGEFCEWKQYDYPMEKQYDGIWELRLPARLFTPESNPQKYNYENAAEKLTSYKYVIVGADGQTHLRCDPYGTRSELRPNTASKLCDLDSYVWHDKKWMDKRREKQMLREPVNIYEMHLGTWKRGENGRILTYEEIGELLVPYIRDMGYTHVEFLPVMEHPFDGSWGYQVMGYYAPTARYGDPLGLMKLIDKLHQNNIGVILDWVPAHFPKDEAGLRYFDGAPCYEHADPRRAEMPQWGTHLFDYGRGEVRSFLLSNACFWLEYYHADGLRCDAVSCMLYHDFCKEDGQWLPNERGDHDNLDAIAFLKHLNTTVYGRFPGVMMIAEEATAFPKITAPVDAGGLGFGFKWNMGWMNDILAYIKKDPIHRKYHHDKITFSLWYAFNENFVLPFSHDEVVHGKHSMLDKQQGDIWQKFAALRGLYGYMMAHPGKKLLFMGGEFGHFIEWKDDDQLDWFLLLYDKHPEMQKYVRELNKLYKSTPAMYLRDDSWDGFEWLSVDDAERSCVSFMRKAGRHTPIVCAVNFTPVPYHDFKIGLPYDCELTEVLCSDKAEFAGSNLYNGLPIRAKEEPANNHPYSASILLPPYGCVYFKVKKIPKKQSKAKK